MNREELETALEALDGDIRFPTADEFKLIYEAAYLYSDILKDKEFQNSLSGKPISELNDKLRADGHGVLLDDAFRDIYKHLVKCLEKEVEELKGQNSAMNIAMGGARAFIVLKGDECEQLRKARNELFDALNGVMYWDNGKPEWSDARVVRDKYKPEEESE